MLHDDSKLGALYTSLCSEVTLIVHDFDKNEQVSSFNVDRHYPPAVEVLFILSPYLTENRRNKV